MILHEWLAFYSTFFEYPPKWCTYSAGMAGATWNCCSLGASSVYTIQPCHFMQSHIPKVYACLTVTCHLHFLLNDQDLLCATAVTRGWNGYQNKSQHRKLTLEKKIILPKVLSCLLCSHMWSAALMFYQYFPVREGMCVWMYLFSFFLGPRRKQLCNEFENLELEWVQGWASISVFEIVTLLLCYVATAM